MNLQRLMARLNGLWCESVWKFLWAMFFCNLRCLINRFIDLRRGIIFIKHHIEKVTRRSSKLKITKHGSQAALIRWLWATHFSSLWYILLVVLGFCQKNGIKYYDLSFNSPKNFLRTSKHNWKYGLWRHWNKYFRWMWAFLNSWWTHCLTIYKKI